MMKDGFTITPFPDLRVSNTERQEMIDLVDNYVEDYIDKYKNFVVNDKCKVNKRRWQHVKSRDKLHVYAKRTPKELEDLMFGVLSPTLDSMRIKASYVQDFDNAAVLCSVVEPSTEEPFQSLVIKWMSIDPPLQAAKLSKSRDFVFIEATGIVEFEDGDCERFSVKPYPDLQVSEEEREQLIDLVNEFVKGHFQEYEDFVVVTKSQVDENRWKHVKSKDNQHIAAAEKDLPVVLSVGTLVGDVDDVMFGVVNPTLDVMRIKASYVHDLDSAAVLCSVVEPSVEEPFRSLVIKWMTIDLPLQSTSLVKSRDFVYIEATGIVHFASGERVGYHLLHSIDFPQTKPLPNMIRGNLSVFGFFRQLEQNAIDIYASGTVVPGGKIARFLSIQVAAEALLSATNYVYCGQMKKLSWMLQHRHSSFERQDQLRRETCVVCERKVTKGIRGFIGAIRKRISFIALDDQLIRRKIAFCTKCVSEATKWDAKEAARDQATGYRAYKAFSTSSQSDTRSTESLSFFD
ncbi:hypothetical protein JG688_00013360 [Phytophthora aleatoria]|uniref:START domain-containing protein n=1 Tax=Phytophthora aleatoria TaxID=2496075 RepID=A0A8J5IXG9_9STRA|nr:hypothetical protein JG688_00013360 [Phytophthora aleatoria]